jgi:hypothetical protein
MTPLVDVVCTGSVDKPLRSTVVSERQLNWAERPFGLQLNGCPLVSPLHKQLLTMSREELADGK